MNILEFFEQTNNDFLMFVEFKSLLVFVRDLILCIFGVDISSDDEVFKEQIDSLSRSGRFSPEDWNRILLMLVNLRRFWNCEVTSVVDDAKTIEILSRYFCFLRQ